KQYWIDPPLASNSLKTREKESSLPAQELDMADWFYVPSWKRSPLSIPEKQQDLKENSILLLMDECGTGTELGNFLIQQGYNVIQVHQGREFTQKSSTQYILNPNKGDDYYRCLETLKTEKIRWDKIVHLWSLTKESTTPLDLDNLEQSQALGLYSLIYLAKAIGKSNLTNQLQITVISNGLHEVIGEEELSPEKNTLLGAVKVIPQEYPNIQCRSIDIILSSTENEKLRGIQNLVQEITSPPLELVIAYRNQYRWIQSFEPIQLTQSNNIDNRLWLKGVYLITGGLGGVGLTLAQYLAQKVQAKLLLIGRSPLPERKNWQEWIKSHDSQDKTTQKIRKIQQIEKLGSEVQVVSADITDQKQMQFILTQVQDQWGEIKGIIHCAGVADYAGIIQSRTKESTDQVLAAKVKGTLVLDKLLGKANLDFFVLCSSLATILHQTKFGQVGYCAANDFLDAFAYYKKAKYGTFTVTINWWDWGEVGMSVESEQWWSQKKRNVDKSDLGSLSCSEGIGVFERVLGSNLPRVAISPRNLTGMLQIIGEWFKESLLSAKDSPVYSEKTFYNKSKLITSDSDDNSPIEKVLVELWHELLGVEKIDVHDDFFELGGDSLLSLQLTSKIKKSFDIELPAHSLIENSTIAAIAELIETKLNIAQSSLLELQQKSPSLSLITLQTGDFSKRPLFLVHPLGGTVYYYLDLINGLDQELPIYGFQSQGLDGQNPPLKTVEEMASHYLDALQSVQSKGPYCLGGSSFGGIIALEMAQRLQQQGEIVELLFMVDPPTPGFVPFKENFLDDLIALIDKSSAQGLSNKSLEELEVIKEEMFIALGMRHRETADRMFSELNLAQTRSYLEVTKANSIALASYSPKSYSGQAILFLPQELAKNSPKNMAQVWQGLVTGELATYNVSGDHFSMNFTPNVQAIAKVLQDRLV
ncbi:SDR family NAD(P)-dependent oxidoreductase, partial [Crocosphaera sp.]